MDLREMKEKGVLPKRIVERMAGTTPGALAAFLSKFIYDLDDCKDNDRKMLAIKQTFVGLAPSLSGSPWRPYKGLDEKGDYADSRRVLNEIRDYLEACALKEILER